MLGLYNKLVWGKLDSTLVLGKSKSLVVILPMASAYIQSYQKLKKVSLVDHGEPSFILLLSRMKDFKP